VLEVVPWFDAAQTSPADPPTIRYRVKVVGIEVVGISPHDLLNLAMLANCRERYLEMYRTAYARRHG